MARLSTFVLPGESNSESGEGTLVKEKAGKRKIIEYDQTLGKEKVGVKIVLESPAIERRGTYVPLQCTETRFGDPRMPFSLIF